MSGLSHVNLRVGTGQDPEISVSLYPDPTAEFRAKSVGDDRVPLLVIEHGPARIHVWPRVPHIVTADDIEAARRLVAAASAYLADCERFHAEHGPDNAAGSAA